jgi:hypothetical protein
MSQPFSRVLHPFDVVRHPDLEPEVKRAILASWASNRSSVKNKPALASRPAPAAPFGWTMSARRSARSR